MVDHINNNPYYGDIIIMSAARKRKVVAPAAATAPPRVPAHQLSDVYNGCAKNESLTDVSELKEGDFVSCTQVYVVTSSGNGHTSLRCLSNNSRSDVADRLVATEFHSLQTFEERRVNHTQMAEIVKNAMGSVVELHFRKKPQPKDQADLLDGADVSTAAKRRKLVASILEGPERVMRCTIKCINDQGRAEVLDHENNSEGRQVDLRTVYRCVFRGRAYVCR